MKKYFLLTLALFAISSMAFSQTLERHWQSDYGKLRIMSYNILNGFNWCKDTEREARFVNYIKEKDPEILALQELCGFTQDKLSELAKKWGHNYAVILKENGYPVGVTSKKPIIVKNKFIEGYGHGLLHVETYGYQILATHLNPANAKNRLKEANNIINYIENNKLTKAVLLGDLNSHSPIDADYMESHSINLLNKYGGKESTNLVNGEFDYSVISRFLSYPLIDVCRKYVAPDKRMSFPTPILFSVSKHRDIHEKVGERLDYILVTEDISTEAVDAFIFNTGDSDYLSDHYPVAIDLFIKTL